MEKTKKRTITYSDSLKDYIWIKPDVLKKYMSEKNTTIKDIMDLTGVKSKSQVQFWLAGKHRISPTCFNIICDYLDISEDELIDAKRNEREPRIWRHKGDTKKKALENYISNPKATITVTMSEPKENKELSYIPQDAEVCFMRNVKFYLHKRHIPEEEFLDEIGAAEGYIDLVMKHEFKIPLNTVIKISKTLGVSVEDLVLMDNTSSVEAEIRELRDRINELMALVG